MGCYRIYVGNLPPTVTSEELKSKFQSFCTRVGNELEIKNKNESTFAYLNLYDDEGEERNRYDGAALKYEQLPNNIQKCIAVMNNTTWKGNLIKVQLAKESFLSKLKKEQQGHNADSSQGNVQTGGNYQDQQRQGQQPIERARPAFHTDERSSKLLALAGMAPIAPSSRHQNHRKEEPSKPAVYDFEIVSSANSSDTPSKLLALAGMPPVSPPKHRERRERRNEEVPKPAADYDFEIVSSTAVPPSPRNNGVKNKRKITPESSSDSSDSEPEVKEGFIPKFRGLLQSFPVTPSKEHEIPTKVEPATIKIHTVSAPDNEQSNKPGIKFNPLKRQKSNDLRLQSMENRFMNEKRQTDVIKHSLKLLNPTSQFENVQSSSDPKEIPAKKKKGKTMELFNEADDEGDEDSGFNFDLKKQFEGESGQKLLELKSKWNFDERFQIDERFKEAEVNNDHATEEDGTNILKEKAGEMDILTQMFGHEVVNKTPGDKNQKKSNSDFVIVPRYDPDLDDHKQKYEQQPSGVTSKKNKNKADKKSSELPKPGSDNTSVPAEPPKKSEYKVADNLKSLFSTETSSTSKNEESNTFSLLAAYGSQANDEQHILQNGNTATDQPRKFWQSNPFKYDSSDEDEEDETKKVVKSKKPSASTYVPLIRKDSFFFKSKDTRFECIEKFFLVADEDFATVNKNFNDTDRAELKSLVKAKIKNTRRKSDKRDEALKRLRRKQKMKKKQTSKSNKKKFAIKQ